MVDTFPHTFKAGDSVDLRLWEHIVEP